MEDYFTALGKDPEQQIERLLKEVDIRRAIKVPDLVVDDLDKEDEDEDDDEPNDGSEPDEKK